LNGKSRSWSLFATDTYKPWTDLAITTSLRLNQTRVTTKDELRAAAPNLDGDQLYTKLNPAIGANWTVAPGFSVFANAAQGNRAPSPIELGCADRANPCSLPNAMQADPFLAQVVTQTFEAGARGKAGKLRWNATLYRADNRDDILFVGTSTSQGYFTNFGRTRRAGIELGAATDIGTVLVARRLRLRQGHLPVGGLPAGSEQQHARSDPPLARPAGRTTKSWYRPATGSPAFRCTASSSVADWHAGADWTLSADLVAYSSQFLRGNENNAHQPGTFSDILGGGPRSFLGAGTAPSYGVLNLATRSQARSALAILGTAQQSVRHALRDCRRPGRESFRRRPARSRPIRPTGRGKASTPPGAPRSIYFAVNLSLD
jgi:iron complex outermembrane receptor protein